MTRILIVEDDPRIARSLEINLRLVGDSPKIATTIEEAERFLAREACDLICLDVNLPDGSGIDLCRKLRTNGDETPIIFLSAATDEETVVRAITTGGDDYLRKPFGIRELKARLRKLTKRFSCDQSPLCFGPLMIDPLKQEVRIEGRPVPLGKRETEILMLLVRRADSVVSRETIITTVYNSVELFDRTIDSHMSHLRKKLRALGGHGLQIKSIYGLGYRLQCR